jgi:hypothetical protein
VTAFTRVDLSGAYRVDVTCGEPPRLELSGDDNLLPLIQTAVVEDTLHVRCDRPITPRAPLVLTLGTQTLASLSISGTVEAHLSHLQGEKLKLDVSGTGSLDADGEVDALTIDVSGAASIRAAGLKAKDVTVDLSGTSTAEVFASNSLQANVSGAGTIRYAGNPKTVQPTIAGVGTVEKL